MALSPPPLILTQHFDSTEVAFNKIDEQIALFHENIRALHAFRNTFTPIYRLPPEILTRIFTFVREVPKPTIFGTNATPLKWVTITHVSQHWRQVAVGSPCLWSQISSVYPKEVAEEWVRRSKAAPISFDLRGINSQQANQFITPELSRVRELTLGLTSIAWNRLVDNLASPAPVLESFSLMITDPWPSTMVSDALFAGTAPSLSSLHLSGCCVDISSSIFANLAILDIRNPPEKLTVPDTLTALQALPQLSSLLLFDIFHWSAPHVPTDFDVVVLPSLESLSTRGQSFDQDIDFLSHLSFPIKTTLKFLSETRTGGPLDALKRFFTVHNASRLQQASPVVTCLDIQCHGSALGLFMISDCASSEIGARLVAFQLVGPWHGSLEITDTPENVSLFSLLPLKSLAGFSTTFNIDVNLWSSVFGTLPKLTQISATGNRAFNVLSAIINDFKATCPVELGNKNKNKGKKRKGKGRSGAGRQSVSTAALAMASTSQAVPSTSTSTQDPQSSQPSQTQSETWTPIFAKLQTIEIAETSFPIAGRAADLIAALNARKAVDKQLASLEVRECKNMSERLVERLQETGSSVVWDGWTGVVDDDDDDDDEEEEEGADEWEFEHWM